MTWPENVEHVPVGTHEIVHHIIDAGVVAVDPLDHRPRVGA
jgi:hypothetical protein